MRLDSLDGRFVELSVTDHEFGAGRPTGERPDWDANWLMVRGKAWDGDRSWEFHDPCMTTWEARQLGSWLRGLTSASTRTVDAAEPDGLCLWLTEPNISFELAGTADDIVSLIAYFDAESRPPTGSNDDGEGLGHRLDLILAQAVLSPAVDEWDQQLTRFPVR